MNSIQLYSPSRVAGQGDQRADQLWERSRLDRKSTRLNSSHVRISYAVFCLKKKIPKHLFQGYLNIYNNYFKAPWMPDRTEANPNELNQDDARYGFRCCHLKNIWTDPLPPETELSRQMTTSTTSIDIIFFLMIQPPPKSTLFPYTTLFRSQNKDNVIKCSKLIVKKGKKVYNIIVKFTNS